MKDTTYYTHYKGEYIQVLPVEECVKSILSRIESYEDTIERLKEENKKLKDEVWKDKEFQDMKEQLDKMKETNEKTSYTIDFYVVNTSDGWTVSSLSNSDIEKLHGIYDYES